MSIDFSREGAAVLSFKADAETAKNHGIYLRKGDQVAEFLHKQIVETLLAKDTANDYGYVDIDTGVVLFSAEIFVALYGLAREKPERFIHEKVRLSFCEDSQYPFVPDSILEVFY